ncbi:MAG TPA: VCBS repeat-containing protein [Candidatus Thermoplasmatota archaeon]|nr:VCBS repeat-containing protein [Candidatus Thermoplasmatota archaeon]
MQRAKGGLLAAMLLTTVVLVSIPETAEGGTTRVLTITTDSAKPKVPFKAFDGNPTRVFDINGDGKKEILVHNDNRHVYVFDSQTGKLLAELSTTYPGGWGARPMNGVEAGVLVPGGPAYVVIANSASVITAYRFEAGASTSDRFVFTKAWERRANDCYSSAGMDAPPVLADLTGDGRLEILVQTEEVGVFAYRADGSILWKRCTRDDGHPFWGGNGEPGVGDLRGTGKLDVVWASDGGTVIATDGRTGKTLWQTWLKSYAKLGTGSVTVGPAAVERLRGGTGGSDVVLGARDSHDCTNYNNNHAALFAIAGDTGRVLWHRQPADATPLTYTRPVVYDVDRDGQKDVLWADWNTQGHKCGTWEVVGKSKVYRFDAAGNLRWSTVMGAFWNNKDLAVADVTGDGRQNVLANGPGSTGDGIWYLDPVGGAKQTFVSAAPWKVMRGPVVGDLWGRGTTQWVVQAVSADNTRGAILVYDTGVRFNAAWPHPPSGLKSSGGGVTPPPDDDGGNDGGSFTATFSVPSSVNEWWVEVKVTSSQTVTAVCASVNGGSCTALAKQSWGNWAKSFHVPAGSKVVFRATSSTGATATSQEFTWLGGGGGDDGGGGDGGSFTASFSVPSSVNEWWVEVKVTSSQTVTAVCASVNGGTCTALAKQSWGNWAKSFFVPDGAKVVFEATSSSGAKATSGTYTWG